LWKNNIWTRGFNNPYQFIKVIIFVNAGMFALAFLFYPSTSNLTLNPLTFLSPSNASLVLLGATGVVPIDHFQPLLQQILGIGPLSIDRASRWWTLISAGYLHGGILHIFFNMAAFRQLALLVSREFGIYRMFIIYTLAGVAGFAVSYLFSVPLTIGASAGICGLLGAALYYGKSRGGVYGSAIYKQVGGWIVFIFIFGLLVPGINNWGHGGGILAGIALGFLLGYHERRKQGLFHKGAAGVCAAVTFLVLIFVVATAVYYRLSAS
jgi:rhomboid protease GluP